MPMLEVHGLQKTYTTRFGKAEVQALKNVSFNAEKGEYIAIMGESGSGKTTLLNLLAALDKPTGGSVLLEEQNLSTLPESHAAQFRRENLGFAFRDFSLLDTFDLENNILLRRRKREFGLFSVLGMGKHEITAALAWETAFSALTALLGGTVFGMGLTRLSAVVLSNLTGAALAMSSPFSEEAFIFCTEILAVIFALLLLTAAVVHLAFAEPMIWQILQCFQMNNLRLALSITGLTCVIYAELYAVAYRLSTNAYIKLAVNAE